MPTSAAVRRDARVITVLDWVFAPWRLPAFLLSALASYELLLLGLLLWPPAPSGLGAFAQDFRSWCMGYDPSTGQRDTLYALTVVLEPGVIALGVIFLWGGGLLEVLRRAPRRLLPSGAMAAAAVAASALGMGLLRPSLASAAAQPAPALAGLRIDHPAPDFVLTNQAGQPLSMASLRGKVVMLTGIYASCGLACPLLLGQAKRALAKLSPRERAAVTVVGVTLDPEHDTPARLAELARAQRVEAPRFNLVTGAPAQVNAVLDALDIQRRRDPKSGVIDHTSLFLLVDREGRVAYRFTLGERQEALQVQALRTLIEESP